MRQRCNPSGKLPSHPVLNVDMKVYTKILASRLLLFLSQWVHFNQVGFIPRTEARNDTTKALDNLHWMINKRQARFFLSLDSEKAFDRVAWDSLHATLSQLGVPAVMVARIMDLYDNPITRVRVNGHLSDAFTIYNGTRQGCPLSPLLYALSLEPMLNRLRANQNIRSVSMGGQKHKLSAYADDILLTLSDPLTSIPNLLEELHRFNALPNRRINYSNSTALNASLPSALQRH